MHIKREQETIPQIQMLRFAGDIPNLMTLAGLCCGMLAMYFASSHLYSEAMIMLLWAAFFDWFDGPVAKLMKGRGKAFMAFGTQLDSLADLVSSGVAPAFILLTIGSYHPAFLPGALYLICAGAIRLAYFNIYGLKEDGAYSGVPIGVNIIFMPLIFLLHGVISSEQFQWILYGSILLGGTLNITPLRFVKLSGAWYIAFACFVVLLTIFYILQII